VVKVWFASACGFVPHLEDPASSDMRKLWIRVESLRFVPGTSERFLAIEGVRPFCSVRGDQVSCSIDLREPKRLQLPVLYYPGLVSVIINGRRAEYERSSHGGSYLVTIEAVQGRNEISAKFVGSRLGNVISAVALLITAVCLGLGVVRRSSPGLR
jgi:hypothetical protein